MAFFVAGTDTNIGKTLFSMAFMYKYGIKNDFFYMKPFQSGDLEENDTDRVKSLVEEKNKINNPLYTFTYPASPHYAATLEKTIIDLKLINQYFKDNQDKKILLEGAGGLLVPITENLLYIDIIKKYNIPTILVCKSGLGTVNHTLLSIEALKKRKINILGYYAFGKKDTLGMDNMIYIERYSKEKFLGLTEIPEFFDKEYLRDFFTDNFNLSEDFIKNLK
jgi:dethiobiotin synthetase